MQNQNTSSNEIKSRSVKWADTCIILEEKQSTGRTDSQMWFLWLRRIIKAFKF